MINIANLETLDDDRDNEFVEIDFILDSEGYEGSRHEPAGAPEWTIVGCRVWLNEDAGVEATPEDAPVLLTEGELVTLYGGVDAFDAWMLDRIESLLTDRYEDDGYSSFGGYRV